MKKILIDSIAVFTALIAFSSCIREKLPDETRPNKYEGQEVTVYFGVQLPEAAGPATKALGEQPEITSLHVAVFGSSGYLKEYKLAEPVPANTYVSAEGEANKKGYKVSLSITSSKVRVHFIANGPATLDFDYESVVMSKLTSSGGEDAYWQRMVLDHGIYADADAPGYYATPPELVIDPDFDLDENGNHQMALVPLVRNFAKLTVVAADASTSHFSIQSFAVVNVPDKGSVAPYNTLTGQFMEDYQEYGTLEAIKNVYPGNLPAASRIDKSYPSETDFANLTNGVVAAGGAVYMYERPIPTSDATVLIVYGTYTDPKTGVSSSGYYKIDLMDGGEYLPILRNFRYQINIERVNRKGKSSVLAALNGAGSADISADISTASQVNISDGNSAISVEYTEKTLPIGGTYTLGVSFTPDVSNGTVDNSLVTYELLAAEANGAVIASVSDISFDSSTGTLSYTTTDVDLVHMKSQKIRVIGTSSTSRLYRDVTIRLLPQQTMTVSCIPEIEAVTGTPQVVTVEIPQDLPQSIFPLQFMVEATAKSLTPDAADLPVEPGETIVAGSSGKSFQFVKTISYVDYTRGYTGGVSRFTCEFKSIIPVSDSDIYVANQYFATGSTSFTTFVKRRFSSLRFNVSNAVNEDDPVQFYFVMDAEHEEISEKLIPDVVHVYLTGLTPNPDPLYENELQNVSGNHYVYSVDRPGTGTQTLHLVSTGETAHYGVSLSADYYEDNSLQNAMNQFNSPAFGTVLYGRGWPTTFSFTIPNTYQMPAVGYIDIELTLTNLVPDDANINTVGGKYYYRATSTGTKTINLKTASSQTEMVAVELNHSDFETLIGTKSDRTYLSIAASKVSHSGPSNSFRGSNNTVNVYTDKALTQKVASYRLVAARNSPVNNLDAINFASNVVDATTKLYMSMYSNYNSTTYYSNTITAEALYNNGGNSSVTFSTTRPGRKETTISTTSSNFSTSNRSYTTGGVTLAFSSLYRVQYNRLDMTNPSTVTVTIPEGYHLLTVVFTYYRSTGTTYYPGSVSITSGGGSYSGGGSNNTSGTWTAGNSTTGSVTLNMSGRNSNRVAISSVVITMEED